MQLHVSLCLWCPEETRGKTDGRKTDRQARPVDGHTSIHRELYENISEGPAEMFLLQSHYIWGNYLVLDGPTGNDRMKNLTTLASFPSFPELLLIYSAVLAK